MYNDVCFYPEIEPYTTGYLPVSDGHEIYYEVSGNPDGIPAIFNHGGPGYWPDTKDRLLFHPKKYKIIIYHQRGCGLSRPLGDLTNNTTQHLFADLDALRAHLGVEKCLMYGGSWGSTLSLLYAQHAPDAVMGLVLYGIYLNDNKWRDWYLEEGGAEYFYPEAHEKLRNALPDLNGESISDVVVREKLGGNEKIGQAVVDWEVGLAVPEFGIQSVTHQAKTYAEALPEEIQEAAQEAAGALEMHYLSNKCFIKEGQILADMPKISHIPGYIINGRYDMICPPKQAWMLHNAWPGSILNIIGGAGHRSREMRPHLIKAVDVFDPDTGFDLLKDA